MCRVAQIGTDAVILFFRSFRTLFSPAAAKGLSARYDLRPRDDRFHAEVDGEPLDVLRGTAYQPDTVITTDSNTLAPIIHSGHSTRCAGWPETSGSETPEGY